MKSAITIFALVLIMASQAWADAPAEVNICHWQDYNGYWKLITVNEIAVDPHLTIHDDSLPGGVTSFTGIELDENCVEAALPSCGTCLTNNPDAGCSNQECQNLVGDIDSFCTTEYWDYICVSHAATFCEGFVCEQ